MRSLGIELRQVLKLEYGKSLDKAYRINIGKFPVYGANGVKSRSDRYLHDKPSIIIGRKGSAGELNLTDDKFWPLDVTYYITYDHSKYDLKYLYYLLDSLNLKKLVKGVKPGINRNDIYSIKVDVPNLQDQQSIVKILDEAFATIAKAKENIEQNLQNSSKLFESYLNNTFLRKDAKWKLEKLGNLCDTSAGGTPLKSHREYYEGGTIPWLRSGEVNNRDILKSNNYITEKGVKNSSAHIFPKNTVLVAMYGSTAGQVGILRFESTTNQAVCGILPNTNYIPEFLYYIFIFKKEELVSQAVGGAQPNISQIKIKNTYIPDITIDEQKEIVTKLDSVSAETKKLEEIYKQKLALLDELKKSLLHQAFTGQL